MVHQVRIDDQVHTALRKEQPDMFLQLVAVQERGLQRTNKLIFARSQLIRIPGIVRRKVGVLQGIILAVDLDGSLLVVDFLQQSPPLHLVFGMALDHLSLDLELDHRNRLVHLSHQQYIALRNARILHHFGLVRLAG